MMWTIDPMWNSYRLSDISPMVEEYLSSVRYFPNDGGVSPDNFLGILSYLGDYSNL